jgi:hypothetical protein
MMKHASYPANGIDTAPAISIRPSRRTGIFAFFLGALHHSRRIQSRRALRQYRHLLQPASSGGPFVRSEDAGAPFTD